MAEAANQLEHDFWSPPARAVVAVEQAERASTCTCGTEFIVGSVYCHACGARRVVLNASSTVEIPGRAELTSVGEGLGLPLPAAFAFLVGLFCVVGALAVSVFFSARTTLDWQAIQLWRIEWLLAAVAAFVAGCLLKK